MFDPFRRDVFGKRIEENFSLFLRSRITTPHKQPLPGGFESSEISAINDQIAVDFFVGRDFGIDREVDEAQSLSDMRYRFAIRGFLKLGQDGLPLSGELIHWMIT